MGNFTESRGDVLYYNGTKGWSRLTDNTRIGGGAEGRQFSTSATILERVDGARIEVLSTIPPGELRFREEVIKVIIITTVIRYEYI
ncbi:MAG: hypothetical protein FJ320_05755 [SAR202 cluster bacterium]|nr:hypothetical protein [SAR202 cluster bacterium]